MVETPGTHVLVVGGHLVKRLVIGCMLLAATLVVAPSAGDAVEITCRGLPATIVGTAGDDVIFGTRDADVIAGLAGADEIHGGSGDDTICGGGGRDAINGGRGNDTIRGGSGADIIRGDDQVFYLTERADDLIFGGGGPDTIWAGAGNDIVRGGRGSDRIYGNLGDDGLFGKSHNDLLVGGPGLDEATGGAGFDECSAEVPRCETAIPELAPASAEVNVTTVIVSGAVSHVEPITSVDFALKAGPLGLWLQLDGTLGNAKVWHPGVLARPGTTASDWSATIDLPEAHYSMSVRATDRDGDVGHLRPRLGFSVREPLVSVGIPVTDFIYDYADLRPLSNGTALGRSPRDGWSFRAIPEDGTGQVVRVSGSLLGLIGGVQVAVREADTGLWLQVDGAFSTAPARHWAICPNCNDSHDGYWLFDVELADGDYTLGAFAIYEYDGNVVAELESDWEFTVDEGVPSTPIVVVDQAPGTEFDGVPVTFSGTASDDFGVDLVRVSVRDAVTGLWLQNLTGPAVWDTRKEAFGAALSDRNETTTAWMIDLDLPPGDYRLSVAVFDEVLHRNSIRPWLPFSVAAP